MKCHAAFGCSGDETFWGSKTIYTLCPLFHDTLGQGTKIPHASQGQKKKNIKKRQYCNKFNKDFKNDPHRKNLKKIFLILKKERETEISDPKEPERFWLANFLIGKFPNIFK